MPSLFRSQQIISVLRGEAPADQIRTRERLPSEREQAPGLQGRPPQDKLAQRRNEHSFAVRTRTPMEGSMATLHGLILSPLCNEAPRDSSRDRVESES